MTPEYRHILVVLLGRIAISAVALAIGIGILLASGNVADMLLGFLFFLIAAIFVAGPIARLIAEPMGGLLLPKRYYDKPQPMYGIPESKRVQKHPEEALAEYEKIAVACPEEVRPHLEMIDIALTDLHDPELAEVLYRRGIATLKKKADQELLAQVYAATRERHPPAPIRRIELHRPEGAA